MAGTTSGVPEPSLDCPVMGDGLPAAWPWWTPEQQRTYLAMVAMDAPPGWEPPKAG